jgi:hypothetical protein
VSATHSHCRGSWHHSIDKRLVIFRLKWIRYLCLVQRNLIIALRTILLSCIAYVIITPRAEIQSLPYRNAIIMTWQVESDN